jgi:glutamate-1-semialdehyde 2,1-aminomutase
MTALRLARAATGREKTLKFAGAYHGHVDGLLVDAGSALATQGIPASPGVTWAQAADTVVVPWNDASSLEAAFETEGDEIAAVIAEPVPANMGVVPAQEGFLELVAERCAGSGALLILDEVITGFRVAGGGAQERLSLSPDITVLGKVLGGGLPLAAVAGPRAMMELLVPAGETYQAGTLSGNPLATAAGLATLRLLETAAYEQLERTTARLVDGLKEAASAKAADRDSFARFFAAMLEQGVYLPPSPFEAWFPSLVHGPEQVERTLEAAEKAFVTVAGA